MFEVIEMEIKRLAKLISREEFATNPELYSRLQRILKMLGTKS